MQATPPGYQSTKMRLFTRMELSSTHLSSLPTVFPFPSASSPVCWRFVVTASHPVYVVINSKGEKGCESPICLWVIRWLLNLFGSCVYRWVASSLCRSTWFHRLVGDIAVEWLVNIGESMLLDGDMSGVKLSMGQRADTLSLLICNTRNEVQQTSQSTTADC